MKRLRRSELLRVAVSRWDELTGPDLHQFFGIDDSLETTWDKPWWWMVSRVFALMDIPGSRLRAELVEAT